MTFHNKDIQKRYQEGLINLYNTINPNSSKLKQKLKLSSPDMKLRITPASPANLEPAHAREEINSQTSNTSDYSEIKIGHNKVMILQNLEIKLKNLKNYKEKFNLSNYLIIKKSTLDMRKSWLYKLRLNIFNKLKSQAQAKIIKDQERSLRIKELASGNTQPRSNIILKAGVNTDKATANAVGKATANNLKTNLKWKNKKKANLKPSEWKNKYPKNLYSNTLIAADRASQTTGKATANATTGKATNTILTNKNENENIKHKKMRNIKKNIPALISSPSLDKNNLPYGGYALGGYARNRSYSHMAIKSIKSQNKPISSFLEGATPVIKKQKGYVPLTSQPIFIVNGTAPRAVRQGGVATTLPSFLLNNRQGSEASYKEAGVVGATSFKDKSQKRPKLLKTITIKQFLQKSTNFNKKTAKSKNISYFFLSRNQKKFINKTNIISNIIENYFKFNSKKSIKVLTNQPNFELSNENLNINLFYWLNNKLASHSLRKRGYDQSLLNVNTNSKLSSAGEAGRSQPAFLNKGQGGGLDQAWRTPALVQDIRPLNELISKIFNKNSNLELIRLSHLFKDSYMIAKFLSKSSMFLTWRKMKVFFSKNKFIQNPLYKKNNIKGYTGFAGGVARNKNRYFQSINRLKSRIFIRIKRRYSLPVRLESNSKNSKVMWSLFKNNINNKKLNNNLFKLKTLKYKNKSAVDAAAVSNLKNSRIKNTPASPVAGVTMSANVANNIINNLGFSEINTLPMASSLKQGGLSGIANVNNKFNSIYYKEKENIINSYISGIKIQLGGRLLNQRFIPRRSSSNLQYGTLSKYYTQLIDKSRFSSKNRLGTFSFTVSLGHSLNYKKNKHKISYL